MLSLSSVFFSFCRIRSGTVLVAPSTAGLKTIEEKLGLPPKPKRPSSSYCLFIRKILPEVRARYPKLIQSEQFKMACEQWRNVNPKVLKELEELAAKEKLKYTQELEKYNAVVSFEEKAALREAYEAQRKIKEKRALKRKLAALGMPKKPMNPYLLFVNDWLGKNPKMSQKEANHKCSSLWKTLPESEKMKWQTLFKQLGDEYHKNMKVWEANMIKEGKLEITYDSLLKSSFKGPERIA